MLPSRSSFLDSCEYYNPDTDEWGPIANMMDETIGAAVVGFNGLLWVLGGFLEIQDDNIVLASVECYDPRTNRWALLSLSLISLSPMSLTEVCH